MEDVKEVAKEVKKRAKRVKEELGDVADAVKEVGNKLKMLYLLQKVKAEKEENLKKIQQKNKLVGAYSNGTI